MKALYFVKHGGPEQLLLGERPLPEPGFHEVRVRIRAAALNRLDLFVLEGMKGVTIKVPHIGGADGAGVIDAIGGAVSGFAIGDDVIFDAGISCGKCSYCLGGEQSLCSCFGVMGEHCDGTFAEFVLVNASSLAPKPSHFSWQQAAAFGLTYLTAWRMLINRGALRPGETVLIHGIGGGVSLACLQLAKMVGAEVIVTSRSLAKLDRALELGADYAVTSGEELVAQVWARTQKRGADVIVDSVGEATWMQSLKAAAKGARIVTCGATSGANPHEEIRLIFWKQLSIIGSTMGSRDDWRHVVRAVNTHKLEPVIDSVINFDDGKRAYERLFAGEQFGKIVLATSIV